MKLNVANLGGRLGVGLIVGGFVLVFLGWNGAASYDRVPSQFPYLISGGLAGLCLVVVGVGVLVIQTQRADRAQLQASLDALREAMERGGGVAGGGVAVAAGASVPDGMVVAGEDSYHLPGCRLLGNRADFAVVSPEGAAQLGLTPCRVCSPDVAEYAESSGQKRRRAPLRAE